MGLRPLHLLAMQKDIKLQFYGKVQDGKISLPSKRLKQEVVGQFDGRSIEVTFQLKRKRRSNNQNAYYWGVVIPRILQAFIDLGNDLQSGNNGHAELIHNYLLDKFLDNGIDLFDVDGNIEKTRSSTTRCTTTEYMEYLDRIIQWAAECLNIVIPEPNTEYA